MSIVRKCFDVRLRANSSFGVRCDTIYDPVNIAEGMKRCTVGRTSNQMSAGMSNSGASLPTVLLPRPRVVLGLDSSLRAESSNFGFLKGIINIEVCSESLSRLTCWISCSHVVVKSERPLVAPGRS